MGEQGMGSKRIDDLQKKASGFLGESVRILRDSLKEAGRLVNATADATKLHFEKEQHVIGTHRDYYRLGVAVYRVALEKAKGATIKLDGEIGKIIQRIRNAEREIAQHRKQLSHMSVVGAAAKKVASSAKNTKSPSRAKQVPRKAGVKKRAAPKKK